MTANELANELDIHVSMGGSNFFKEAATMLREQQRTIDGNQRLINLLYEKERQQQAEIESLKSGGEPVAWMNESNWMGGAELDVITNEFKQSGKGGDCSEYHIPLYDHPHFDNLGLAESIIKQQELLIAELEADVQKKVVMIGLWEAKFKELAEATGFAGYLAGMMVFEDKTPQITELSDEEIYKVWFNYGCGMPWTANTKTFIRAILKKASEK